MEIILSKQCESLTGSLDRRMGYYIRRSRAGRFYSQRSKHGTIPHDGHWRFILTCAQLAQNKLHIADIQIDSWELQTALYDATHYIAARIVRENCAEKRKTTYNARDIINLQITFGL